MLHANFSRVIPLLVSVLLCALQGHREICKQNVLRGYFSDSILLSIYVGRVNTLTQDLQRSSPPLPQMPYQYKRFTIRQSDMRSPTRIHAVPRLPNVGVARAQCAVSAEEYRLMEEGRVPAIARRPAYDSQQAMPVQSFFLDSTPELSLSASD